MPQQLMSLNAHPRWSRPEDLPLDIVPFKASIYKAVAATFGPLIQERSRENRLEETWWSRR